MKKKKLNLDQIKVESFTTDVDKVKGGDSINFCITPTFDAACNTQDPITCGPAPTDYFTCGICTFNPQCTYIDCW